MHHPVFPTIFQLPLLIFFVAFAIAAWGYYTPEGVPGKLYGQANLVNLAVWGLWWPAMVAAAILLGRVWCLPLFTFISHRKGRN